MPERLLFDLETNGFNPSLIWVIGIYNLDTDEYTSYVGEDEIPVGLMRIAEAEFLTGHNVKGFDLKVINKLTEGLITIDPNKVVDTCELSRLHFKDLPNHKLETWGEIFEDHKIKYDKGFDAFHPEMVPYCEQDVRLNVQVYRFIMDYLAMQSDGATL